MSRIAKYPVELPKGVEVTMSTGEISVKGPLGTLKQVVHPSVSIEREGAYSFARILCTPIAGVENFGEVMILDPRQPLPPAPPVAKGRGGDGGDKPGLRPKKKRATKGN